MGLFRKKVYLTESQEHKLLTLSEHYHLPYDYFVDRAIEEFLDRELAAIKPNPPIPPKTRSVAEGEKP
ncbi:hypothetical protein [Escherichia phage EC148]|uniref:Uncharacterized protein n=1 Tax=Escherichia phage EC148 TaxID=2936943 RepID=A0A9E7IDI8_9CAUD|nr:hypothetical protein [Escherichia coli]URF91830.1 hypothetical protein [Escherichia phage EC148]WJN63631.1 hypothetical protein [Escherichia phage SUT_E1520]WLW39095.1 hypothetical protein [Escherichia phage SUT_E420]WLW39234.1 hypothetical protein [Escherichia phage SUT_E520]